MQKQKPQNDEALMKAGEVSRRLNVSVSLVYKLIDEGKLKAHRINSALRISEGQLTEYLAAAETQAGSAIPYSTKFF